MKELTAEKIKEIEENENFNKNNWTYICANYILSKNFIEKYQNKLDWQSISIYQKLSEDFMEKYKDKIYWKHISAYQQLSEQFIEKYKGKLGLILICHYQNLSETFIKKNLSFFNKNCINSILLHQTHLTSDLKNELLIMLKLL